MSFFRDIGASIQEAQNSARSVVTSRSSLLFGGTAREAEDIGVKKHRIQEGLRRAYAAKDCFEKEGLITSVAGEGEEFDLPTGSAERIVDARYFAVDGSGASLDVLARIKQDIMSGNSVSVSNASMGGDPMPGKRKVLQIKFKPKLEPVVSTIAEGQQFQRHQDAFESVVAATYGAEGVQADVLVILQAAMFDAQGKPITVNNETMGGDPLPNVPKFLRVTSIPSRTRLAFKVPTSKEPATFQVIAPWLFHDQCDAALVPQAHVYTSLTSEELTGGERQASGKSGEIFWFSADRRFVLKTISDGEVSALVRMLPEYSAYLRTNRDSLLTRYLGVFSLDDNGVRTQVVVMNNIFEGSPRLDVMYDLKGTTEDRWVDPGPGRCLKDNNFAEVALYFGDETAREIHRAIAADTRFMERYGIMDYSLMCALAWRPPGDFRPTRRYSKLMGGLTAHETVGVLSHVHKECIVFIGMVDMLVTYDWKKVAAHVLKSSTIGWAEEIDTVAPGPYASRFRGYFAKKILGESEQLKVTEVSAAQFDAPMPALGRSGGTAAFFEVTYKDSARRAPEMQSKHYWIGKDLARARDEVDFYERARSLQNQPEWRMLAWMTPYLGVCNALCEVREGKPPQEVEVMLLRNCRDGYKTCRMLDVKIGNATAVAGWQGKSSFSAWLQVNTIDANTNSEREGFRLEGFDNPPDSLCSIEELLTSNSHLLLSLGDKKLKRLNLQRLTASRFLAHFLDIHDTSSTPHAKRKGSWRPPAPEAEVHSSDGPLSVVETQELVLLTCIEQLARLVEACRAAPAPQQWIGSSVMLAFDSARRPRRAVLQPGAPRCHARVHIFDWGRSELNTLALHERLEDEKKGERQKYWGYYCGGVATLLYECCRLYMKRFWHEKRSVGLTVWDKDQFTADDFIGVCVLPLQEGGVTRTLSSFEGAEVKSGFLRGTRAQLYAELRSWPLPKGSRLRDRWVVRIHEARNLPAMDLASENDTFVEVTGLDVPADAVPLTSSPSKQLFLRDGAHSTTVAIDEKTPVFQEEFQIATLTEEARAPFVHAVATALGLQGQPVQEVTRAIAQYFPTTYETAVTEEELASLQTRFAQSCFPGLSILRRAASAAAAA